MHRGKVIRCSLLGAFLYTVGMSGTPLYAQTSDVIELACSGCHRDQFEAFQTNPHSALQSEAWQERSGEEVVCLTCHGDVSQHLASGGGLGNVFAFREESPLQISDRCLNCHSDTHPGFASSPHATAGLGCTDCHSNHSPGALSSSLLKAPANHILALGDNARTSAVCADCHGDVLNQFAMNERHRLREGVLECTSCHNPHEQQQRIFLGGFKQEQCMNCHADKGGPFVFEHPASRMEGCTACHSPHGSPNRHLLMTQRVAETCLSCHAIIPQFHFGFNPAAPPRFGLDTQCTNCHSSIHGSNFDSHFLK